MNVIINGFQDERTIPIVRKISFGLKIDEIIYTYTFIKPNFGSRIKKTTLLNWRSINFFGDYNLDFNELDVLDEGLVDSMRKCEALVLKMMDRLETLKNYSYAERKDLYLKHLRYWNHVINNKKIDFFLSSNVPHETSDFVCYSLCKLSNIPTVILFQGHIPDTCFICDDWEKSDYDLPYWYKKLKAEYSHKKLLDVKLSSRFEKYYGLQIDLNSDIKPCYMKKPPLVFQGINKISSIIKKLKKNPKVYSSEGKIIFMTLSRKCLDYFNTWLLRRYYEKNCTRFNPDSKYIFVALHLAPEMTISPRADAYVDQILIVQLLSACVPRDIKILVKEHPNQRALCRTKIFYRELLTMPNVELVSRKVSSRDLISNCIATATCVGLAGFEGLFQGKPLLMFGHDFLQYSPGTFSVRTKQDLEKAIKKISSGQTYTLKDFRIFLKAYEESSIFGTIDSDYGSTTALNIEDNALNISKVIILKIKEMMADRV